MFGRETVGYDPDSERLKENRSEPESEIERTEGDEGALIEANRKITLEVLREKRQQLLDSIAKNHADLEALSTKLDTRQRKAIEKIEGLPIAQNFAERERHMEHDPLTVILSEQTSHHDERNGLLEEELETIDQDIAKMEELTGGKS